jgi:hypothetical protein
MDIRYRKPVLVGQMVAAVAERRRVVRGFVEVVGKARLPDGTVAAEATGTFAFLGDEELARMSAGYPRLAEEWMRGP